ALFKLKIGEVPTVLSKDGRNRPPHLRTWRDGWRHLRFLLLYSPAWLFLYPGLLISIFSTFFSLFLLFGPIEIKGVVFDIHTLLYSVFFALIGFQLISFFVFSKTYAINENLLPE